MPAATTATTAPNINWTPEADAAAYNGFMTTGYRGAGDAVLTLTGTLPIHSQIDRAVARHAYYSIGSPLSLSQCALNIYRRIERRRSVPATRRTTPATTPTRIGRSQRCFGIEIEYNRGRSRDTYQQQRTIVSDLRNKGIGAEVESYNHDTRSHWKLTYDATVTGGELVSPILDGSDASIDEVRECIRTIKDNGGTTSVQVGMHVHHDVRDFNQDDMARLVANLAATESLFLDYVNHRRVNGSLTYGARRLRQGEWNTIARNVAEGHLLPSHARTQANRAGGCDVTRYVAYNFNSVLTYGTIEFRALGATLNPVKVRTWIEAGMAVVAFSKDGGELTGTEAEMLATLVASGHLRQRTADRFAAEVARRRQAGTALAA